MSKPPTFHSFSRLNQFMTRLYQTPIVLRVSAFLFMLVLLAMLIEAVKMRLHKHRTSSAPSPASFSSSSFVGSSDDAV